MAKWWDKFEFFESPSVYHKKGLISLVKKPENLQSHSKTPNVFELFKDLFQAFPKELRKQLFQALGELEDSATSKKKGEC